MGKRAKVIHVIPTIGGCGSTTIAMQRCRGHGQDRKNRHGTIDLDLMRRDGRQLV